MFCKNCGKEIKEGTKFCPACGTMVSNSVQQEKKTGNRVRNNHVKLSTGKGKKKPNKWIAATAVVVVLAILIVGIIPRLLKGKQTAFETKDYGFDESIYKDNNYTKKQIKELKKAYEEGRKDEEKAWPLIFALYKENISNYEDVRDEYDQLIGGTEDVYQMLNEFDPNLKEVAAKAAADEVADGPMSYYLTEKGVATILADNELGKEIRAAGEDILLGVMEYMTISQMQSDGEIPIRSDQMVPVAASDEYALIRSYGTVNSMLDQTELLAGEYKLTMGAIEQREEGISSQYGEPELFGDTSEEDFEINLERSNLYARSDFLEQKKTELQKEMYQVEEQLLEMVGIEDSDSEEILKARFQIADTSDEQTEEEKNEELLNKYVYSMIDKEGEVYFSFLVANPELHATINDDGICSLSTAGLPATRGVDSERCGHVILNKKGDILFEDGTKGDASDKLYSDISTDGNVLEKTFGSNSSQGEYENLAFVQPDGTSKTLLEGGIITLDSKMNNDYYSYTCEYQSSEKEKDNGVIDMTTGELITNEEYREIEDENFETPGLNFEFVGQDDSEHRLNKDYVFKNDMIYDNDNKEVKDLSQGSGVEQLYYMNDKYWIITQSGYYYSMDENFEELGELKKLPKDKNYIISEYGIITVEDFEEEESNDKNDFYDIEKLLLGDQPVQYACLYDEENQQLQMFQAPKIPEVDHFLTISKNMVTNPSSGGYNLNTKELLFISMPKEPISLELE